MTERWYQRPKPRRRIIIATSLLAVIVLLLSFAPTYIARYFISATLDDFGIEHDGIKSFRVNIWKREVWVGPVRFRTGDANQGQLGELGIKVRVFPVFQKHAYIEKVFARGIDLYVAHEKDNSFTLNGIPLDQFRPDAEAVDSERDVEEAEAWGAGLFEFEIQDSRLIFKEQTGGTLAVEIERFRLDDFQTWEPDQAGSLLTKGSVNGVKFDLSGQARPFAKHITITLDAQTLDLDLAKILEFTGPLGFERKAGVYNSTLHHEITLFENGQIEGLAVGEITLQGADYEQVDKFSFAVEQAALDIDINYEIGKKFKLDGKLALTLDKAAGKLPGENSFNFDKANIDVAQLSTTLGADNSLQVKANPKIDIKQGLYSGRMQLSMDVLLNVLSYLQSLSVAKTVTEKNTGLNDWSGEKVTLPMTDISVSKFKGDASLVELKTVGGEVSLNLATVSEASDINIATKERSTNIKLLHSKLDSLSLHSGDGKLELNVAGSNKLSDFKIKGPLGKGDFKKIGLNQNLELAINRGDIRIDGSAKASIEGTDLSLYETDQLPPANVVVKKLNANVTKGMFSLVNEKLLWQVKAGTFVDQASVDFAKKTFTSAKIHRFEINGAQADQDLNIIADTLKVIGLKASLTRQFIDGMVSGSGKGPAKQDSDTATSPEQTNKLKPEIKFNLMTAEGSTFHFSDENVQPHVKLNLDIQKAEVRDVNTRDPKKQSSASLITKINEFTNFELNGQASNPGPKLNLVLKGKLDDLELPPYSSYAAEFGGVNIDRGKFNSNVDITADNGKLDGAIKLNIQSLEFTTLSEADAQRLSEAMGVPIETAASLLRDSKGNIDLSLPVQGTVVEPSVSIRSAITKAIGKTLKMVFPPTLIGSMLMSGKKEGAGLAFEPIIFKPGSSELDKDALTYLDELATLLKERPRLSLDVCGRTTPRDFFELTLVSIELKPDAKPAAIEQRQRLLETHGPKLRELAGERTQVVRRYFINDKGLKAKQVGQCRAIFDPEDSGSPRVVIKL